LRRKAVKTYLKLWLFDKAMWLLWHICHRVGKAWRGCQIETWTLGPIEACYVVDDGVCNITISGKHMWNEACAQNDIECARLLCNRQPKQAQCVCPMGLQVPVPCTQNDCSMCGMAEPEVEYPAQYLDEMLCHGCTGKDCADCERNI
jgi:hypothetical protein